MEVVKMVEIFSKLKNDKNVLCKDDNNCTHGLKR